MSSHPRFIIYQPAESRLERWRDDLARDLRFAARQLARAPGFAALVVATLALGIGANVMMASVIDRLLLRAPPGIRVPDRVVRVVTIDSAAPGVTLVGNHASYPELLDYAAGVSAFQSTAGYAPLALSLGVGPNATPTHATVVTPNFFALLGVAPTLGRFFGASDGFPTDGAAGGPPLAVLSYGFWQRHFGADRRALGRAMRVGQLTYTIVGIAPPGFRGVEATAPDLWLPITVTDPVEVPESWFAGRGSPLVMVIARLAPGAGREVAAEQATVVARRSASLAHVPSSARVTAVPASIIPGRGPDAPRQTKFLLWLGGVSLLVLLIACANVANLLLARAVARRREVAVRLALGVSRARLARQLLAESLVLVMLGGGAALYLALTGSGALERRLFGGATGAGAAVDPRFLAFTAAVALGTAGLIALAPWLQSLGLDLTRALRVTGSTSDVRAARARSLLLGTQAALAMILLVTAALFVESLDRVRDLDLGVDLDRTLMVRFDADRLAGGLPRAQVEATYRALEALVHSLPGVERVALAETVPYGGGHAVDAHPRSYTGDDYWQTRGLREVPVEVAVDSGYFHTVGAASLRGRDFASTDRRGAPPVAIVDEALARLLWPGADALGRCLFVGEPPGVGDEECVTVVGVLPSFRLGSILDRGVLTVFRPLAQLPVVTDLPHAMFVRVRGDPRVVAASVRHAVQGMRADLPAVTVQWMRDALAPEYRPWEVAATMFSLFGAVALAIAVVGLYGVVAFAAAQRAQEVAIRCVLGARPHHVLATVARPALAAVAVGLAAGALAVVAAHRWLAPLLFGVSARDPRTIAVVALVLATVAGAASLTPVLRTLRRPPAAVLRQE